MSLISSIYIEILSSLSRGVTGQLFTDDQIKAITSHAIGRYLSDWLPEPEEEKKARESRRSKRSYR